MRVEVSAQHLQRRGRLVLVVLFILFLAPVAAALLLNVAAPGWLPFGVVNRGELVTPVPVDMPSIRPLGGPAFGEEGGEVAWRLVYAGPPPCAEACRGALTKMRQARLALGKEAGRVARWWLVTKPPDPRSVDDVRDANPGLHIGVVPADSAMLAGGTGSVHLVDPAGLMVLRYRAEQTASAILKDMKRLLRISTQG